MSEAAKKPHPPVSGPLAAIEEWLYEMLVTKAPFQLPKNVTDWIVKYGPWITLAIGLLSLPLVLAALALLGIVGTALTAFAPLTGFAVVWFWLALVALIAQIIVMFISIPMLLNRQRNGWLLLFYAELANLAYRLFVALNNDLGSLIGALIGAVIGLYVLFQIRSYYVK